jgi:hypothetical protein
MGRERGGGRSVYKQPGPEWTGVAPHAKEGFQVSKRDSGTGVGFFRQRGNYHGESSRGIKGIVPCALI